jgi:predicted O-linked N-acetylglucosamine transferase (SPINDLY family)
MAGSLLQAIGLPELICGNLTEYARAAAELAHDPSRLRRLRERLHANRTTFPLFDTTRFCANLERAYTEMHRRAERGEKPQTFAIEPD